MGSSSDPSAPFVIGRKRPNAAKPMFIIAAGAALACAPAHAQSTPTDAERRAAYERGTAAGNAELAKSRAEEQRAYDRIIRLEKGVARATSLVRGGRAVYEGSKAATTFIIKKRKDK